MVCTGGVRIKGNQDALSRLLGKVLAVLRTVR